MSDSEPRPQPTRSETKRALLILVASASFFGLMAFTAKLASARVGGAQVAMIRFAVGLVPILLIPTLRRQAFTFHRIDVLFYRGVLGGFAVLLYFLAIQHIPVGLATLLNYTSPIFAGFFAAAFIGEPIRGRVAIPLTVALCGIYLVVRSHAAPGELIGFGRWEAAALLSAVFSGSAVTFIRLARRTEGSWAIFGSLSVFGLLATGPFAAATWVRPSPLEWLLLIAVGVVSIVAQILMTHAYRWVETLVAGTVSQLGVIVSMLLGAAFLSESLTALSILGTALAILGVSLVIRATTAHARLAAGAAPPA